jgi:hypothetical protein
MELCFCPRFVWSATANFPPVAAGQFTKMAFILYTFTLSWFSINQICLRTKRTAFGMSPRKVETEVSCFVVKQSHCRKLSFASLHTRNQFRPVENQLQPFFTVLL